MKSLFEKLKKSWALLLKRLHLYHVLPAIFWACLVYIGHHALPIVFDAPDQLAYTFTQTFLTAQMQDEAQKPGLIALLSDKNFYGAPYYGEEPTPRCAVLESLQKITAHEPKALVIDINLSPTYRDLLTSSKSTDAASCQSRLEQFLINTAAKTQLILIDPMQFPVDSPTTLERRLVWRKFMEQKGVYFGHADIQHSLLSALTQFTFTPDRMGDGSRLEYKTEAGMSYRLCQLLACNKNLEHELPLKEGQHLINYAAYVKAFNSKFTDDIEPTDIKKKIVYFGFALQGQDQRATPIGLQYGVEIHAAYYASLQEPIKTNGWIDIIGDVLIGVVIAFWGDKLVQRFVSMKKEEIINTERTKLFDLNARYAYFNVVYLVAFAAITAIGVLAMSYLLLASPLRVWTSPLVMIFAMCLDLFCRVPFEHLLPHAVSHKNKTTDSSRRITNKLCIRFNQLNAYFWHVMNKATPLYFRKQISTLLWHCVAWSVPFYCFYQLLISHH